MTYHKKYDAVKSKWSPDGYHYIYRTYRICPKTGQKLYAKAYGYKVWPILVKDN